MFDKDLTPFKKDSFGNYFKREDYAGYSSNNLSSGTKVRAFNSMIKSQKDKEILAVGCSADSLMQVYITEMALKHNLQSKIFIPKRNKRSKMTEYCITKGANVEELPYPCYPSHYKKAFKEYAMNKKVVSWNPILSTNDTIKQIKNLPNEVKRIVVPTGSGAIAIGIISGLIIQEKLDVEVICVKVSKAFGGKKEIIDKINKYLEYINYKSVFDNVKFPDIEVINPTTNYGKEVNLHLEDGTELDPLYSAKAYKWLLDNHKNNSCLWISGRRPNLKIFF
tara:strand:+ start:55 stop:891 length:837 start_codon:yes stop_codon:yes gene_type:complete